MNRIISHPRRIAAVLGILCILSALALLGIRRCTVAESEALCNRIVSKMQALHPAPIDAMPEERSDGSMPTLSLSGYTVSGLLEIPAHACQLPISAQWQKDHGLTMPAVFSGSVYDRTLVLGGVDEDGQLSCAEKLAIGDIVRYTDLRGYRYSYAVTTIRRVDHVDADQLSRAPHDLAFFVKQTMGMQYIIVYCTLSAGQIS